MSNPPYAEMDAAEDIVIVGGGICGLATALALYRKGIKSVVLERSETLRASGGTISILTNGWRALDQLGVGSKLRETAILQQGTRDIWLGSKRQRPGPGSKGEARTVKRSDLLNMLARDLPHGTVRFRCHIISVELDPMTNFPTLLFSDGRTLMAKILIGCDGANSAVAEFLNLRPNKLFPAFAVRGLTHYPSPHGFAPKFVKIHGNNIFCGTAPVTHDLAYWVLILPGYPQDPETFKDQELIKEIAVEKTNNFPKEIMEMIECCDINSISLKYLWYRPAWDILMGRFRKGTITVAGDAMHVMGPFIAQGGSAALEDAVVLARCLANKIHGDGLIRKKVEEAIDLYVKERRLRLVRLCVQSHMIGLLHISTSITRKLLLLALMTILFPDPLNHTDYDCGHL